MKKVASGAEWEKQLLDLARRLGWTVAAFRTVKVAYPGGRVGFETPVKADGAGWVDFVLVKGDRILFREAKTNSAKLTKDQRKWRDLLVAAGCDWATWRPRDLETKIIPELSR